MAQLQTCPALAALGLCVGSNSMAHAASHRSSQVQDVLKQNSKQLGTNLSISGFVRVQVRLFLGCSNPHRFVAPASFALGCYVFRVQCGQFFEDAGFVFLSVLAVTWLWHAAVELGAQVGEGLEAETKDFAAEVAELAGQ